MHVEERCAAYEIQIFLIETNLRGFLSAVKLRPWNS